MNEYKFYGWQTADVFDKNGMTPRDYYDILSGIWCAETCAPRMRGDWTPENRTLGQCSITAFLLQDIFGGAVHGVPLEDGNYHCFNKVQDCVFDLTSEQFGDTVMSYENCPEQSRDVHFAKQEKKERYELLKSRLEEHFSESYAGDPVFRRFYNETNPERRFSVLASSAEQDKTDSSDVMSDAVSTTIRNAMLNAAHSVYGLRFRNGTGEDLFLQALMDLMSLTRSSGLFFSLYSRQTDKALKKLGFTGEPGAPADPLKKAALGCEIENAFLRYLATCEQGRYSRKLFGMIEGTQTERTEHAREDLEDMSRGWVARLMLGQGTERQMATDILCEAAEKAWDRWNRRQDSIRTQI